MNACPFCTNSLDAALCKACGITFPTEARLHLDQIAHFTRFVELPTANVVIDVVDSTSAVIDMTEGLRRPGTLGARMAEAEY
jgi:transcription elongation factor Elf1